MRRVMKSAWLQSFLFVVCSAFTATVLGQSSITPKAPIQLHNLYELKIEISRDGKVVATPSMKVVPGRLAQMTIGDWDNIDSALRIQVTAADGVTTARGEATADVNLLLLENVAGAWVIVGEPRLQLLHARQGSVEVSGTGSYVVKVTATPAYNPKVDISKIQACGAAGLPLIAPTDGLTLSGGRPCPNCPQTPCDACPNCCSSPCTDGSGSTLTCCGAVSCCACGTCCDVPM